MDYLTHALFTCLGLGVFVWRLWAVRSCIRGPTVGRGVERTSIIVPARNEASNLPRLLESLDQLHPPPLEIIVVDDHSDDDTAAVAGRTGATVVSPAPIPEGWLGKSWACHTGVQHASGDYLLFTDADTVHAPDSLAFAIDELERKEAALVSYVPTHIVVSFWERFQGIYHLLLMIATQAGSGAEGRKGNRRFAIGQYLLFTRASYEAIGGHRAVAHRLSEDLALGAAVATAGARAAVLVRRGALRVRMYPEGLRSFVAGWRRSFRDGIGTTGVRGVLEMFVVVSWMMGVVVWSIEALATGRPLHALVWVAVYLGTVVLVAIKQHELGDFSVPSALAYPVFLLLFIVVSLLVSIDAARRKPVVWRGRTIDLSGP